MNDITTATPAEVDAVLFAELQKQWIAEAAVRKLIDRAHYMADDRQHRYSGSWHLLDAEALERVGKLAASGGYSARNAADLLAELDAAKASIEQAREAVEPLHHEFDRRGGWTRAYLVDNTNGHVHRSMNCSTCYASTQFHWLTEYSGATETEILTAAGWRACDRCYPTGRVDRQPTVEGPNQRRTREEAQIREAERIARDAAKAAKAISNSDGTPLFDQWDVVATVTSAWNRVVGNIFDHRYYGYDEHAEVNERIVAALAAKTGETREQVLATIEKKITAKAKREGVKR